MNAPYKPDLQRAPRAVGNTPEPAWSNECAPTYTLDREVARARREMGEEAWQRLNAEWPV